MTYTLKNISKNLHERIKQVAKQHRRSINSEILLVLEQAFEHNQNDNAQNILKEARAARAQFHGETKVSEINSFKKLGRE